MSDEKIILSDTPQLVFENERQELQHTVEQERKAQEDDFEEKWEGIRGRFMAILRNHAKEECGFLYNMEVGKVDSNPEIFRVNSKLDLFCERFQKETKITTTISPNREFINFDWRNQ